MERAQSLSLFLWLANNRLDGLCWISFNEAGIILAVKRSLKRGRESIHDKVVILSAQLDLDVFAFVRPVHDHKVSITYLTNDLVVANREIVFLGIRRGANWWSDSGSCFKLHAYRLLSFWEPLIDLIFHFLVFLIDESKKVFIVVKPIVRLIVRDTCRWRGCVLLLNFLGISLRRFFGHLFFKPTVATEPDLRVLGRGPAAQVIAANHASLFAKWVHAHELQHHVASPGAWCNWCLYVLLRLFGTHLTRYLDF